jgi:hypothetical protein
MKLNQILVLGALLVVGTLASCSSTTTGPNNTIDPAQTPNQATSDTYYPLTEGSTWTYTGVQNYTQTATGDSTIGGKSWKRLINTAGGVAYARWVGNLLKGINISPAVNTDEIAALDITPGAQWTFDITSTGIPTHYVFTDSLQGQSITVLGKKYDDVIVVHLVYGFSFGGITQSLEGSYYYAKNVGLVEADLGPAGSIMLQSYSIK